MVGQESRRAASIPDAHATCMILEFLESRGRSSLLARVDEGLNEKE
jgi:hypothetical protein